MTWKANRLALRQGSLFPLCTSAVAGVVIITPVLVVLWRSLTSGKLGFTVGINADNYLRVFADKDIWPMLSNSTGLRRRFGAVGDRAGRALGVDRGADQYTRQRLGGVDAALSAVDAADHEEYRLDSSAGAEVGHSEWDARTVFRDHLSGFQRIYHGRE